MSIRNDVSFLITKSKESPYGDFSKYTKQLPYNEYKDENGNYLEYLRAWTDFGAEENPLYESTLNSFDKSSSEELVNNFSINWKIFPSLLLKGQISLTRGYDESRRFTDPLSKRNSNALSLTNLLSGELSLSEGKNFTYDMNTTLSYNGAIGDHMLNALAGISIKQTDKDQKVQIIKVFLQVSYLLLNMRRSR
ncbi:MAG: hypothetical protein ACLSDJ_04025 [Butyricimonas faecihominis]